MAERRRLSPRPFRDGAEIFDELSPEDEAGLLKAANHYARGLPEEGEDLLREALVKVLVGDRRWPRRMRAVPFLRGVIKSMASNLRRRQRRFVISGLESVSPAENAARWRGEPEVGDGDAFDRIVAKFFADDPQAAAVAGGLAEGLRGRKLAEEAGVGFPKELATVRRRIRRVWERRNRRGVR